MTRRKLRTGKAGVAIVTAALIASLMSTQPASAYPAGEFSDCSRDHVLWKFEGSNWNGLNTIKAIVRDGMNSVGEERDYGNSPVVFIEEDVGQSSSGDELKVYLDTSVSYGAVFPSDCHLRLNPILMGTNHQLWYKTVRHEMGHAIGMEHSGILDNTSSPIAVMGSCVWPSSWNQNRPIGKDQAQYANYLHNDATLNQYTANGGFETGIRFWGGNNMEIASSSLEYQGASSIRLKGLAFAYNSYINQTMTVWDGAGTLPALRSRYFMRESSGSATVTTMTKSRISARALSDEGIGVTCGGSANYPPHPGLQPNKLKFESGWIVLWDNSVSEIDGTSWSQKFTSLVSPSGYPDLASNDGLRIQAKFYGRSMNTSNQRLYFYADNVRMEGIS